MKSTNNKKIKCDFCKVNMAEARIINGKEVDDICSECCKESLYDIATSNETVIIHNTGTYKGLTVLNLK